MRPPRPVRKAAAATGGAAASCETESGAVASNTRGGRARRSVAAAMDPPGGGGGGGASTAAGQAPHPQHSKKVPSQSTIRKVNLEHFKTRFSMLRICELFPHFSNDHHPGVMVVVQGSPQVLQALHSHPWELLLAL
ncbi:unnamed protein product [Urochloa humidicola]